MSNQRIDPQMMNLSSSDISDSDESPSLRSDAGSVYLPQDTARISVEAIRKATAGINQAKESLQRKKERYEKKSQSLKLQLANVDNREKQLIEMVSRVDYLERENRRLSGRNSKEFVTGESPESADKPKRRLEEENAKLRHELNDLRIQLELQSRSVNREGGGEKERLRRRALELTHREQALLEKEQEIDEWHEEAARLRREAEDKSHEAERLFYSKQKYIDELESDRQRVTSRETELDDVQRLKEEAIDQRREQVRLLEEALASHNEQVEARIKEVEKREKSLTEHEEDLEREMTERENRLSEHQEEIEEALTKLKDTQHVYAKMDGFVKEKRQQLLEKESELRRHEQQFQLKQKQKEEIECRLAHENSARIDAESHLDILTEKMNSQEQRINELQRLLAESRNDSLQLRQEYMRYKDIGDTADRRINLFSNTNVELQQKIESQNVFILQLQKRIAELQESNYFITNDHSRATLALNEVSGQVSRLLAAVNGKSPQKQPQSLRDQQVSLLSMHEVNGLQQSRENDPVRRQLFPLESMIEEKEKLNELEGNIGLGSSFSVHNNIDNQSVLSVDMDNSFVS